jgi:hypothetical protein
MMQIEGVEEADSGLYECQVSTEPKSFLIFHIAVIRPKVSHLNHIEECNSKFKDSYIWSKAQLFMQKLQNKLDRRNERNVARVGGACPAPFIISIIMYKVVVYAPAERVDTLALFLLYPYIQYTLRSPL